MLKFLLSFLRTSALLALACVATPAMAEFPNQPIKLVVPLAPGGGGDLIARLIAAKLQPILGQAVVVENRPGGATTIGTRLVAQSSPDGYTLILATSSHVINSSLIDVPFDPVKDFSGVALMTTSPLVLAVNPKKVDVHNVAELVEAVKASPQGLTYGSSGIGSLPHLSGELLTRNADIRLMHVPYKGSGPAETDLLGGQIDMYFGSPTTLIPHVERGSLRLLATTGAERSPALPDIPTMTEIYPGFSAETCYVVLAPAQTPQAHRDKLNAAINEVLEQPDIKSRLTDLGANIVISTPDQAIQYVDEQVRKWNKLVREANIQAN